MRDLKDWLACPNCGDGSKLAFQRWSYGFRAECKACDEVIFYET